MQTVFEMQRSDAVTKEPMESISLQFVRPSNEQNTAFALGLWERLRGLSNFM